MNLFAAASTGFGLGLVYFGGLWLSVRALATGGAARFTLGRLARLGLAGATLYWLLAAGGVGALLAGLAGVVAARWCLVRQMGGGADAA